MFLCRSLLDASLSSVGMFFGGRDHTTVMHAIKTIEQKKTRKTKVIQTIKDLRKAKVDVVIIGQYLQPSPKHHPLSRYYHPDEFKDLEIIAKSKGFLLVSSSPLTRSSYHADEDFAKLKQNRRN